MATSTSKPSYPQSVVDAIGAKKRTFDVVVEQVVATIELDPKGHKPAIGVAFAAVGNYVDENPHAHYPLRFNFEIGGDRFKLTVDAEPA